MFVSGFSFVRNGTKFDYPYQEAVLALLGLCDEVVVAVGRSDDDTLERLQDLAAQHPKLRLIETVWDDTLREGGRVLAVETDKAFDALSPQADWAVYLQADELLHEADYPTLRAAMEQHLHNPKVQGLLLRQINFYGSYDYIGDSRRWQHKQIRVIRNDKQIRSYRDAMSFRRNGQKLGVKAVSATVYHYGWVKPPAVMQAKNVEFNKLWHDDHWVEQHVAGPNEFDYSQIDSLVPFTGSHPAVMQERVWRVNWSFSFDPTQAISPPLKVRLLNGLERLTGRDIGRFRNYRKV